jgi:UDP-glucose 4-epimerase
MKVIIFGDSGFVGKNLKSYLLSKNIETYGVSRTNISSDLCIDICNYNLFENISFIPDVVINCASVLPEKNALNNPLYLDRLFKVNTLGAANIANWAKEKKVRNVFNLSTLVVTKKPWKINLKESDYQLPDGDHVAYCMSKISQEQLMTEILKDTSTQITNLRLSAIYGDYMKREGILYSLLNRALSNKNIELVNGDSTSFNFLHVSDLLKIIYILIKSDNKFDVINIASDEEVSLRDLASLIINIVGSTSNIVNIETERLPSLAKINIDRLLSVINEGFEFTTLHRGLTKLFRNEISING